MEQIELTCICCPLGCQMSVKKDGDNVLEVSGNTCPRGDKYARNEVVSPVRSVTSTVKIESKFISRIPVKTKPEIPKSKIFDVMNEINKVSVKAPVKTGDVIIQNVLGTGSDIVATMDVLN